MKRRALLAAMPAVLAAGGSSDAIMRLIAEPMGRDLGQPVVVENAGGAGGTIGAARVANARPDGWLERVSRRSPVRVGSMRASTAEAA